MRIELKDENQEEPQKIDENDIRYKHETDLTKKEKRELEKMKLASMGWKGKLQYIWAYYKPQMAAIVAVIAISFFVKDLYENSRIHTIGGLEINEDNVEVTIDGETVKMTPIEYKILLLLVKSPGRVFSAEEIYERVWNERAVNTDTIMVHVRNIREKIELNPREPKYLKVVWGVGYKIEKQA